jgi:hypothetical protein
MIALCFAPLLAAASCSPSRTTLPDAAAECPVAERIEFVPRNVYVPLDARVTQEVVDPEPGQSETYGEAVRDSDRRAVLLQTCNNQLREAREQQGTAKK